MLKALFGLAVTAILLAAPQAHASIVLNFSGLNGSAMEAVDNYYDGGTGSFGSSGGTNYGISFSPNALACSGPPGGPCNTAEIPGGTGANSLFFETGSAATMNVADGFTKGFSFFYTGVYMPGDVTVWSGVNGTGTLLATLNLPTTPTDGNSGCDGTAFCPFVASGTTFAGTAKSVDFGGSLDEIAFADITLGSEVAGGTPVPEPSALALLATGLVGVGWLKRRRI